MRGEQKSSPPNAHWVALYTFIILLPLVYFIPPWVIQSVSDKPFTVTVVSVAIITIVVNYFALPLALKAHLKVTQ